MTENPCMTLTELIEAFRANQIAVSEETLGDLICEGRLPFAVGVKRGPGHKRKYIISRAGAYQWIESFIGHPAVKS